MEKQLLILFGKAGAGKNFVAELLAGEYGFYFYDADTDLTKEMINSIKEQEKFTDEMRNKYFNIVINKLHKLVKTNKRVVLTQGLFKNKNRVDLIKNFPYAKFIWVDADEEILEERVLKRKSIVTLEYAKKINEYFEEPNFYYYKVFNNSDETEVIKQLSDIVEGLSSTNLIVGREN